MHCAFDPKTPALFAVPPSIEPLEVLGVKLPA